MPANLGFKSVVLEEACRAIDMMGSLAAARQDMSDSGVLLLTLLKLILHYFNRSLFE